MFGTISKPSFVREWIKFKQRALTQTYYYYSNMHHTTFRSLTRNRLVIALRGMTIFTNPIISLPVNLLLQGIDFIVTKNFINDPMEVEAFARRIYCT